jgi:hypothetical protein
MGLGRDGAESKSLQAALAHALGVPEWKLTDEIVHRGETRRGETHAWARLHAGLGRGDVDDETRALAYALAGVGKPVKLPISKPRPLQIAANVAAWQVDLCGLIGVTPVRPKPVPQTNAASASAKLREQFDKRELAQLTAHEEEQLAARVREERERVARWRHEELASRAELDALAGDLNDVDTAVASLQARFLNERKNPPPDRPPPSDYDAASERSQLLFAKNKTAFAEAKLALDARIKAEGRVAWEAFAESVRATYSAMIARVDEVLEQVWRDEKCSLRWIWCRELRLVLAEERSLFCPPDARRSEFCTYAIRWLTEHGVFAAGAKS